jgi:hypothetical protein
MPVIAASVGSVASPNWYEAMVEFRWTVGNIMLKFRVPRAIASHIQHTFPCYADACRIAEAHRQLCDQVGH